MFSLIIVDYNSMDKSAAYLKHCVENLKCENELHAVIVDNGTLDNSLALLEKEFGTSTVLSQTIDGKRLNQIATAGLKLIYCHSGANLGYAKGNNLGARIVEEVFKDEYYIISNNDLVFLQTVDLAEVEYCFRSQPDMGVLGPRVVGKNGLEQSPRKHQSAFVRLIAWYWAMGPLKKYVDDLCYGAERGTYNWVSGCFFFVSAEAFVKAGRFDSNTFLFAEEMILGDRLRAVGYQVYYDPCWSILHNHGETVKKAVSIQNGFQLSFDSNCYYYKTYCNTSAFLLRFARLNFWAYKKFYPIRSQIKRFLHRT